MKNKKIKIGGNNLLLLITIVLFIVMYGIGCVVYDDKGFGHFQTFLNLLITNAGLICVACGMTCVMLTGGIDISVGSLVGLDCMIMAYGMTNLKWSPFVAIAVVLIVGIVFGAVQGFLIGVLGIQPFIISMAGMFFARGMIAVITTEMVNINNGEGSGKFIATVLRNPRLKAAISDLLDNRDGLMIGICNGFQALIKLGLLPYGEIRDMSENDATLTFNTIGRHSSQFVDTRIGSVKSPWLANVNVGDVHVIPISHGEGRFVAPKEVIDELFANGQVFSQYVDPNRKVTMQTPYNPNGSMYAIEGIVSRDGRVLGKMGHSERQGENRFKNVYGEMDQKLFEAGVNYFRGGK